MAPLENPKPPPLSSLLSHPQFWLSFLCFLLASLNALFCKALLAMVTHFHGALKVVVRGFAYYFCVVKVHHLWLMLLTQGLLCVQAMEFIEESNHIFCVQVMALIKVHGFLLNKNFSWMHMCFVLCFCCKSVVMLMFQVYFSSYFCVVLKLFFHSWTS
jgi:hypothetical protein